MGRKKLYKTREELLNMHKIRSNRYYKNNSDKIKEKNLKRYHEQKINGRRVY